MARVPPAGMAGSAEWQRVAMLCDSQVATLLHRTGDRSAATDFAQRALQLAGSVKQGLIGDPVQAREVAAVETDTLALLH